MPSSSGSSGDPQAEDLAAVVGEAGRIEAMNPITKRLLLAVILVGYLAALVVPIGVFFNQRGGTAFLSGQTTSQFPQVTFPVFGLVAFTLVTMQILLATNLWWLKKAWPRAIFFHRYQGSFALLFAILHPLFILIGFGISRFVTYKFVGSTQVAYVLLGEAALTLLFATVLTALLAWSGRRFSWWFKLHRMNYVVFALIWLHSWLIGSDVRPTALKYVWIGYLVAVVASVAGKHAAAPHRPMPQVMKSANDH